jgi:hypothetical protein
VAVKTEALSIFALLLSAPGGFLPLDKDLSWMSRKWFAVWRKLAVEHSPFQQS